MKTVNPATGATTAMQKELTLSRTLLHYSQRSPEQVSIYLLDNRLPVTPITYSELLERSASYASALRERGIERGQVAIIILNHSEDLIFAFFGAVLAGAVPSIMPFLTEKLSPDKYRESLTSLLDVTSPGAVLTYQEFKHEVETAVSGRSARPGILVAEDIHLSPSRGWEGLEGLSAVPRETALLQHSSGTTGLQKGVALSHQAIFNQLTSYTRSIRLVPEDVIVSWLPLYHDMGLIAGFLMPVLSGVPLVLMSPFDWVRAPHRLLKAITEYQGTLCWLPNFAYNFCAQKIRDRDLQDIDLSSWRAAINCSEPVYPSSHEMFLERFRPYGFRAGALATSYAMAENVFAVTQGGIDSPVEQETVDRESLVTRGLAVSVRDGSGAVRMLSSGVPIQNTAVRVVDPQGNSLPERHVGEISIKSDCMLTGYYNRPDLTEQAFQDGWYLTGDLGYLAGEQLYVTGRKKDLIIVGGKNIYPQDIELLAGQVSGIHPGRVVAFGIHNEQTGTEDIVVVAEADGQEELNRQAVGDQVRQQVNRGSDIALRYVHVVERGWLVKTSSGKVARAANREKYLSEFSSNP